MFGPIEYVFNLNRLEQGWLRHIVDFAVAPT